MSATSNRKCPACGLVNFADAAACGRCGMKFRFDAQPVRKAPARPVSPHAKPKIDLPPTAATRPVQEFRRPLDQRPEVEDPNKQRQDHAAAIVPTRNPPLTQRLDQQPFNASTPKPGAPLNQPGVSPPRAYSANPVPRPRPAPQPADTFERLRYLKTTTLGALGNLADATRDWALGGWLLVFTAYMGLLPIVLGLNIARSGYLLLGKELSEFISTRSAFYEPMVAFVLVVDMVGSFGLLLAAICLLPAILGRKPGAKRYLRIFLLCQIAFALIDWVITLVLDGMLYEKIRDLLETPLARNLPRSFVGMRTHGFYALLIVSGVLWLFYFFASPRVENTFENG